MKLLRDGEYKDLLEKVDVAVDQAETLGELQKLVESSLDQVLTQFNSAQWTNIGVQTNDAVGDIDPYLRSTLLLISRQYWLKDPLIHQAVELTTHYVFGNGLRASSNNDDIMQIINDFWMDEDNLLELTSQAAQQQKSDELQVDGEIFFLLFTSPDGRVKVRTLPPEEITQIVASPDDHRRSLYYERKYIQMAYDFKAMRWENKGSKIVYYADWRNYAPGEWGFEANMPSLEEGVVYHVAVNKIGWQRRGYPEAYAALDWVKAHRGMLQDWVTIVKAYSTLAWKVKVKGDDTRDIDRIRSKLASIFPQYNPATGSPMAPAGTAGVQYENDDVAMTPIKTAGMATSPSDARQVRLQVAAGTGIMDHYFGDAGNANLATATAMELPMLKKFTARQRLWEGIYANILAFAVLKQAQASGVPGFTVVEEENVKGIVISRRVISLTDSTVQDGPRNETGEINVTAPPILESNLQTVGQGLSLLAQGEIIPPLEATRYALRALDLPNVEEILNIMYPDGIQKVLTPDEKFAQQMEQQRQLATIAGPPGSPPTGAPNKNFGNKDNGSQPGIVRKDDPNRSPAPAKAATNGS